MANMLKDAFEVQSINVQGANIRIPTAQTRSDKKAIIEKCNAKIAEMKSLWKEETGINGNEIQHLLANGPDLKKYLETATSKVRRIIEIINDNKGIIAGAKQALECFDRHQARLHADIQRIQRINNTINDKQH